MRILSLLLAGCSAEYQVLLDGQPAEGLAEAAAAARPGSVIELAPGEYEGGVTLANGVTLQGNGATVRGVDGPLLVGGDLTLIDLVLVGGSGDEGAAVKAEALVMERVEQSGADGLVAVHSNQSLEVRDSRFDHDGIALAARSNLGRSRAVWLEGVWTSGDLDVEADEATLIGVEATQLNAGGPNARIEQTTVVGASLRGRAAQIFGLDAAFGVVAVDDVTASDLTGGSWTVDADTVQGVGWAAQTLEVTAETAVLADLHADRLTLTASGSAQVAQVAAPTVRILAPALTASDVEGIDVELGGNGVLEDIRAIGPAARLATNQGTLHGALVVSDAGPATLELEASAIRNLLVVEPPGSVGTTLFATTSYATIDDSTFRVGRRTALAPSGVPLGFGRSIVYGEALGDIVGANVWDDTVAWSVTEVLPPRLGLTIDDPLFLPGSPEVNPISPWVGHGAFIGPFSATVQQRWDALE